MVECSECDYKANKEVAIAAKEYAVEPLQEMEKIHTPQCTSMDALSKFLKVPKSRLAKTLVYRTPRGLAIVVVRGDYEVSLEKLYRILKEPILGLASADEVKREELEPGYLSPLGINPEISLVIDDLVVNSFNLVYGANEPDYHYRNVNYGRDYDGGIVGDVALVKEGERCLFCGKPLKFVRCLELGHIFKMGDYYCRSMDLSVQEERGGRVYPYMGAYGIGLERLMAAIVEANHDDQGIVWPLGLAPYRVYLLTIGKSSSVRQTAEHIHHALKDIILYDDREESAGVKLKDADMLGIPLRVVVSSGGLQEGYVEVRERRTGMMVKVPKGNLLTVIEDLEKGRLPV
jgi:prolyl-tRNA synthetase